MGGRQRRGRGRHGGALVFPGQPLTCSPSPASSPTALWPSPHLVLGQQLASPVGVGDVMQRQAQVVVTVFKQQGFGLLHQIATQRPLQLQHLLWAGRQGEGGAHHPWLMGSSCCKLGVWGHKWAVGARLQDQG